MSGLVLANETAVPAFGEIVEAFVARDYAIAANAAGHLVHQARPIQEIQLGLICLQRVGGTDAAARLARAVIDRVGGTDPWSAGLVALTLGERAVEDVLTPGMGPVEACQARFYAGAAAATGGRTAAAARQFDLCLDGGAACLELYLAGVERADLPAA